MDKQLMVYGEEEELMKVAIVISNKENISLGTKTKQCVVELHFST